MTMQIQSQELNPCTVQLTVTCSPEQVKAGFDKAYRQASKQVKVPGFRPGTAPRAIIANYLNEERVREMAVELIIKDAYPKALKEQDLKPIRAAAIEKVDFDADTEKCEFVAKVPLESKVELGDYVGLEAQKPEAPVTDEDVENFINGMRERQATREKVEDRGAEEGDFAVVNLKPEGDEGDGKTFMAVVGSTFPQLDQLLMGMHAEDAKQEDLTFPESFQDKDWAGKIQKCRITLRSLSAPKLPDLSDDFAKGLNAESVDELRERVKKGLEDARDRQIQDYVSEQLIGQLLDKSTIHVADNLWEGVAAQRLHDMVEEQKKPLSEIASTANMSEEELLQRFQDEAKLQVRRAAAIYEVFKKEDMKLVKEDVQREIVEFAMDNNVNPNEVAGGYRSNTGFREQIDYMAIHRKVMGTLAEKANLKTVANEPK